MWDTTEINKLLYQRNTTTVLHDDHVEYDYAHVISFQCDLDVSMIPDSTVTTIIPPQNFLLNPKMLSNIRPPLSLLTLYHATPR